MSNHFDRVRHIIHFGRKSVKSRSREYSKLDKLAMSALFDILEDAMLTKSFLIYERQRHRQAEELEAQRKRDAAEAYKQARVEWDRSYKIFPEWEQHCKALEKRTVEKRGETVAPHNGKVNRAKHPAEQFASEHDEEDPF